MLIMIGMQKKEVLRYLVVLTVFMLSATVSAQTKELPDFTGLVEKYGAAVVNISTVQAQRDTMAQLFPEFQNIPEDSPFYEFFRRHMQPFSAPRKSEPRSMGSGFIISADGYILTNAHVVESAEEITVKLNDKREFVGEVIGTDKKTDIALIKIDAESLPEVSTGDPDELRVGEWVVAIGSPFGFENSVTAGIVSAKGRSLAQENYVPFIQTDVAINPGNSGGPLFNMSGEVVGINSQIYSRTGGFMGLSFAIPINVAIDIANQLKTSGAVRRGRIGVMIQEVTKELAESFGISDLRGALVVSVEKGGPADAAGLKPRDIIIDFNGQEVETSSDLPRIVGNTIPDSSVIVKIWRDGSMRNVRVKVGEIPSEEPNRGSQQKQSKKAESTNRLGLVLGELSNQTKKQLDVEYGIVVEAVQPGIASQAGIRQGDVIVGFNSKDIKNVEQFNQMLDKVDEGRNIALLIKRGDLTTFVTMKLENVD
jgi:serine protease Do